jgi:antitoxin (DNA-binding transcriptional repressor) of toxin-antitoxin stability system
METVAVSEFRSNLMKFLRAISLGEKINITSRGKVIAKLVPPDDAIEDARKKLNEIGKNAVLQDITSPIGSKWDMLEE